MLLAGELVLEGVGQSAICAFDSFGRNSLQDALQASFAEGAGVPYQMVDISPDCEDRRRGLSVKIDFKISLQTSSLTATAITAQQSSTLNAVSSFVSSGAMAESFTEEATKRGEIVSVSTVLEETRVLEEILVIVDTKEGASDVAFYAVVFPNLLLVGLLVVYWIVLSVIRARNGGEHAVEHKPHFATALSDNGSSLGPGIELNTLYSELNEQTDNHTEPAKPTISHSDSNEQLKAATLYCGYENLSLCISDHLLYALTDPH